jgi:3-methyladenine DNA glycosylase AlkD
MERLQEVLNRLKDKARPDQLEGMSRYGISPDQRLGLSMPDMRKIAKEVGRDHELALALWKTGIQDAMIVASMVGDPDKLTEEQMEEWVKDINSWDVCDQLCMNLFEKTPLVWKKISDWSDRPEEFVKRAAYSLIACLAWHDKQVGDERFIALFPVLKHGATDERNYVKKAVNWALRNIGKRSRTLNMAAIELARDIQRIDSKTARWVGSDAIRELESEAVQGRLKR